MSRRARQVGALNEPPQYGIVSRQEVYHSFGSALWTTRQSVDKTISAVKLDRAIATCISSHGGNGYSTNYGRWALWAYLLNETTLRITMDPQMNQACLVQGRFEVIQYNRPPKYLHYYDLSSGPQTLIQPVDINAVRVVPCGHWAGENQNYHQYQLTPTQISGLRGAYVVSN
ncbi:hypothetical protein AAU61_14460 [Desulfocarbo indianensis]|nr:hypothetical protein AAU61_14460 [Desulfocarbo indianensis]